MSAGEQCKTPRKKGCWIDKEHVGRRDTLAVEPPLNTALSYPWVMRSWWMACDINWLLRLISTSTLFSLMRRVKRVIGSRSRTIRTAGFSVIHVGKAKTPEKMGGPGFSKGGLSGILILIVSAHLVVDLSP